MSKKSQAVVKKHLKELRKLIDESDNDFILQRIAYDMENAVIWATENTEGWDGLVEQAQEASITLKQELHNNYKRFLNERT